MGLIRAAKDAVSSMMADQWREYFYCDSLSNDVLVVKGQQRVTNGRNSNTKGVENIISNGSIVAVNEGQCMIIVDQGGIVEFCADAGEFVYDSSTEPSLFYGNLGESVKNTFSNIGKRFTFGGNAAKDQRIYFFNIKEIMNNLFGTASPIPFRVIDQNIGLDLDTSLRCNGEYSFHLVDPLLFYKNVCGNVTESYTRSELVAKMKAELLTALQPALAKVSAQGVRPSEIPAHTEDLTEALKEELSDLWTKLRGIEIVTININSAKIPDEDAKTIADLQRTAVLRNTGMAAATMTAAQAEAMKMAASNTSTGPMMAFAGMNMATQAGGINADTLKETSELLHGSFTYTVLDAQEQLHIVRGNNPFCLYHFPKQKVYLYTSTKEILNHALHEVRKSLHGSVEEIRVLAGDILCLLPDGTCQYAGFSTAHLYGTRSFFGFPYSLPIAKAQKVSGGSYIRELKNLAGVFGYRPEDIDAMLDEGLQPEEIEEFFYYGEI